MIPIYPFIFLYLLIPYTQEYKISHYWHLDNIENAHYDYRNVSSQKNRKIFGNDTIDIYLLDTKIDTKHSQFYYSKVIQINVENYPNDNCKNHGNNIALSIIGKDYGVSPGFTLISVPVLDCSGFAPYKRIIKALRYIYKRAKITKKLTIINISINGPVSEELDRIIYKGYKKGIYFVVSAGNDGYDACYYSPSNSPYVITVGGLTFKNKISPYSNTGSCVNVYAPGFCVYTLDEFGFFCGTSISSGIVSGVLAVYLQNFNEKGYQKMLDNMIYFNNKKNQNTRRIYLV